MNAPQTPPAGETVMAEDNGSAIARVEQPAATAAPAEPAAATGDVLDAVDIDLDEFIELKTRLGGRAFIAREPSIATQKALIRGGASDDEVDELDDELDERTVEDALESLKNLSSVYPQVAQVLRYADGEEQGRPPSREFVEEHMRISGFQKLFRQLLGGRAEGEESSDSNRTSG
jgi:hypothetical protein